MHVAQIIAEKGASVLTAGANDRITRLLKLLASRNVGAIVICDAAGAVIGIVSERDIVRAFADNGAAVLDMTAADLMTREVVTCSKEDTVIELMSVMTERRIRHLPVIDDGVLAGVISIGDVVKYRIAEAESELTGLRDYVMAQG
ncbi:MAG: CBS domain-containing protein [Alphaproteobacteria bacterium]|jgi:CBS domain-containing protein